MNPRSVGIFAVVVAILVGVAVFYLNSNQAPHVPAPVGTVVQTPTPIPAPPAEPDRIASPNPSVKPAPVAKITNPAPTTPPPEITEDDRRIDEVLRAFPDSTDEANAKTARALINLLPTLTPDGQSECISHIGNVLSDDEWKMLMPVWKNPGFNPEVLEAIYTDLMNRDDKVKLPALVEAIRLPNHPEFEEAKSTLEIFLDEDYGNDVTKWDKAVKTYLKKQADEEAGTAPQ